VATEGGEVFNLADPRCYLSLEPGGCARGSLFRRDQESDVLGFTSHHVLLWERPWWQRFAEATALIFAVLSSLALIGLIVGAGVPGLVSACGSLLAWWLRRR
jgi:hypothetical protein